MTVRQPARLPEGDQRFAPQQRNKQNPDLERKYICDKCGKPYVFWKKSCHFDGQYLNVLESKGRTAEMLGRLYEEGKFNALWHCSLCHKRPEEDLADTRLRLGIIELERVERTSALIKKGRVPC